MIHMREYNARERRNVEFLVNKRVEHITIQITQTGINKSTLDATAPVRTFFKEHGIHDFEKQSQGESHKVSKRTVILTDTSSIETQTTMFRPNTKKGDPRLWIYGFRKIANPNDILAITTHQGILYVIVLTQIDIAKVYSSPIFTPLKDFISAANSEASSVSDELLGLIKERMADWLPTEVCADTGIGRAIETILGIPMNPAKTPDFKGIEIKSKRIHANVRNTLFTQSPNWSLSKFKSAREICTKYGYNQYEDGVKRMHITLSTQKANRQHLALNVNILANLLEANEYEVVPDSFIAETKVSDVVVWQLMSLHKRLTTKHKETFWINVENKIAGGREFFRVKNILHTKNPIVSQFDILLEQGHITVDFLICRRGGGDTYSFKIDSKSKASLFPQSEIYVIN